MHMVRDIFAVWKPWYAGDDLFKLGPDCVKFEYLYKQMWLPSLNA